MLPEIRINLCTGFIMGISMQLKTLIYVNLKNLYFYSFANVLEQWQENHVNKKSVAKYDALFKLM